jgi:RNA polymerase sigma factor (sigma-70 family)
MTIDVTKYEKTINELLSKFKIPRQDRDDAKQECFLHLMLNTDALSSAQNDRDFAEVLCKNRILDIMRGNKRGIKTESLDDPRSRQHAEKISGLLDLGITDEQLQEAVIKIPKYDQYQVIHSVYIEGKTEEQTAKDLKMTRRQVSFRKEKGIAAVKKYFQENV